MRVTFEPTSEVSDAGPSSAFAQAEYRRLRHETQERDRGDALGALTWLFDRAELGVLVAGMFLWGVIVGVFLGVILF